MWYLNRAQPVAGIPQTTATWNERRADQRIADYRLVLNGSDAYYDAARVSLVLPRRHNLSMDVSYWFSKAMDLGSSYTNTAYDADSRIGRSQWEFETHKDLKARSEFDQPHAFLWHVSYMTPGRVAGLRRLDGRRDYAAEERDAVHRGQRVGRAGLRQRGWQRRRPAESAGSVDPGQDDRESRHLGEACCRVGVRVHPARRIPRATWGGTRSAEAAIHNVNASVSRAWVAAAAKCG